MQTTLSIDDDVFMAAEEMAAHQHKTVGEVISDLARRALQPKRVDWEYRNGVPLLPVRPDGGPVTVEMVNRLRDELGE